MPKLALPGLDVDAIRLAFRIDVVFGGDPSGPALPCWFSEYWDHECSAEIQACHFIRRQRIENFLWKQGNDKEEIFLAAWDPRLAVPGCTEAHPRFDGHLVSLPSEQLNIFREEVPAEVEEAALEWGLEIPLEERCPERPKCPECDRPSSSFGGRCLWCRGVSMQ